MDTVRLKELVKIQKKSESSKTVKKEFYDLWLQFIKEDGPGEEAFQLLVDGFSFAGMEPFVEYLRTSENVQKTVITFMHSTSFCKNSAVAFKCALNLLACLIRDIEMEYAACAVIMRELPRLALTKEKQIIKDIGKMFSRNLFSVIYAKSKLPSLNSYGLNDKDRDSFVVVISQGLEDSKSLQLNEKEIMGARLVSAWVQNGAEEQEESAKEEIHTPVPTAISPIKQEKPVEVIQTEEGRDWSETYRTGLNYLKDAFEKMQSEMILYRAEIKRLSTELESLRDEYQKSISENDNLKEVLKDRESELAEKNKAAEVLEDEVSWLRDELDRKRREINDRIQMNQIVQMDSERQSDQQLKRLGSELSTYYQDIKESEKNPMSTELGEILRDQILDVFKVLIRNGIRVDQ